MPRDTLTAPEATARLEVIGGPNRPQRWIDLAARLGVTRERLVAVRRRGCRAATMERWEALASVTSTPER